MARVPSDPTRSSPPAAAASAGATADASGVSDAAAADGISNSLNILHAVLDATPDAIFVKDLEGRYVLVNAAAGRFLGKPPAEMIGRLDNELYPAEMARAFVEADHRVLETGEPQTFEGVATGDGITQAYLVTKGSYRDKDGNPLGVFGISHDITERKRTEEAIRKSEEYRNLFVLAKDPIVILQPADLVVLDVNDKACELYGFAREDFIGRSFRDLSADVPGGGDVWARLLKDGTAPAFETVQFRSDGTPIDVSLGASLIEYRGETAILSINRDVTERNRIAAELERARDTALESVRLKSEFLANMSHEIRTPMNGIIGMTELALDTQLTKKQRDYLEMVQVSAESLLSVIDDILDFSKIEAGHLKIDPIEFDLQESLDDTMKPLAMRADQKGLELTCYIAPDVPTVVVGDSNRLRQILVNLVGNAIKFTERGEVSVVVENAAVTDADVHLHFSVTDTGIGIPREKHAVIFQPFAQADGSTTRQYGGTGLGLAITSQLVELMGGRIWVESPVDVRPATEGGSGSRFHFTIQLERGTAATPSQTAMLALRGVPVLVVDDNGTNRRILQEALTNWHLKPTLADGGRGAIVEMKRAALAGRPYTLVLLDAHMPELDGFSVAAEIGRTPQIAGATIMMLSSASEHVHAERCQALGLAAYLTKPVRLSELRTAILQAIGPVQAAVGSSGEGDTLEATAIPVGQRHLHVLVADDTVINQRLAAGLLLKRGHTVEVVGTGKAALEALEHRRFDLVLMDVQMPEMSGFEATVRIREGERLTGAHIPILAMTAHAMKGDRERCLAAGMDVYVSKPVRSDELWAAIAQAVASRRAPEAAAPSPAVTGSFLDRSVVLGMTDGHLDLAYDLADGFLESTPKMLAELRDAIDRRDSPTVAQIAHRLKTAIRYFADTEAADAAELLERIGSRGDLADASTVLTACEQAVGQLMAAVADFTNERGAFVPVSTRKGR